MENTNTAPAALASPAYGMCPPPFAAPSATGLFAAAAVAGNGADTPVQRMRIAKLGRPPRGELR